MAVVAAPLPRRSIRERGGNAARRHLMNQVATGIICLTAAVACGLLLLIVGYIVVRGAPALNLAFFVERPLPVGEVGGGVAPAILGTVSMVLLASIIALPVGLSTAIYLSEYGRGALAGVIRFAIDLLAGLPSIVVGVFVWAMLVRHVVGQYS